MEYSQATISEEGINPYYAAKELKAFIQALLDVFAKPEERPKGKLILSFRKEWLSEIRAALSGQSLPNIDFRLERLNRDGIIEAVSGISKSPRLKQKYKLRFKEGEDLPTVIADDLWVDAGAALAPTLQILLTKMWETAQRENEDNDGEGPQFTLELYEGLRKKGYLLGDFLDQQIAEVKKWKEGVVSTGLLLDILHFHTTPMGTAAEHNVSDIEKAYSHAKDYLPELIQKAVNKYILIEIKKARQETKIRFAHDTLAPLVRKRFEESDLIGQRARRVLESRRADWVEKVDTGKKDVDGKPIYEEVPKDSGDELDESALFLVKQGKEGMREWDNVEEKLIEASEEKLRLEKEEEAKRQKEVEDARKRRRQWQKYSVVGVVIFAVVVSITAQCHGI